MIPNEYAGIIRPKGTNLEFQLTEDQKLILNTVRKLVQDKIRPDAAKYMEGAFPWENMEALAEVGVLGMAVPKAYGGMEASVLDTALVLEEIAKGCYVTAMAALGEVGTQTRIISTFAPEEIKKRILPEVVSGRCILSICMTEPQAGTDVAAYTTNATVTNDGVTLKGTKTYISRAEEAGMFVVFTRVNNSPGREGIGCILVEGGTAGLNLTGKFHTMGGEFLHEVQFDNCKVPVENLIIDSDGFKKLLSAFNTQRCLNPSISLGLAEAALDDSISYMKERVAFGRPIGDFQGMQWKIARMFQDIEAARSLLYRACISADPFPDPTLAAAAKVACNEMSIRVTSEAIQVHGGYGYTDDCPASRYFKAARYGSIGGGTTETLHNLIGRNLMNKSGSVFDRF